MDSPRSQHYAEEALQRRFDAITRNSEKRYLELSTRMNALSARVEQLEALAARKVENTDLK